MELKYVTLLVDDLSALRDWYTQHLGLRIVESSDRAIRLAGDGSAELLFHVGEPVRHPERVSLHFLVDDVDAETERLAKEGVEPDRPPADMPWGLRTSYFRDPAGHTVELVTPVRTRT